MRKPVLVCAALAAVMAVGGCAKKPADVALDSFPQKAAVTADPPLRFDTGSQTVLPGTAKATNTTLDGPTAYIATGDGVTIFGIATSDVFDVIKPSRKPVEVSVPNTANQPPLAVSVEGKASIIAPVPVTIPGQGTTPTAAGLDVLVIDAASRKLAHTFPVAVPDHAGAREHATHAIGVSGSTLIVTHAGRTYALDLATGAVRWQQDAFEAVTLNADRLVGITTSDRGESTQARDPATGAIVWTDDAGGLSLQIQPGGPRFVIAVGMGYFKILDTTDGHATESGHSTFGYDLQCFYDQRSATVCWMDSSPWTSAFDANTGIWLWSLPNKEANRTSIKVTGAWHGAVYGKTANGPLVLDIATGQDLVSSVEIAPVIINQFGGIAQTSGGNWNYFATAVASPSPASR